MAEKEVKLKDGYKIDDATHETVFMKELSAGDIFDAMSESEKVVQTPNGGSEILISPALMGINSLRRMISRVGDKNGLLTISELRMFSSIDFAILQEAADDIDRAAMGLINRGRDGASS